MNLIPTPAETLRKYLDEARDGMLSKLDGLDEHALRWPHTATGANLLGILKHAASIELGYLGDCFDRPSGVPLPWFDEGAELNADFWCTPDETVDDIRALARAAQQTTRATLEALPLDAVGRVPWWTGRERVTLHQVAVHTLTDLARHAGHMDIVRELIDGRVGLRKEGDNMPEIDWQAYRTKLERLADQAPGRPGPTSTGS
ncbi:DinB family protein [Aestuariimicrobium kwangyangense]|uniref:DinB family protein n=1 Tax=Aestuariimicrobium kwangyangense TaxID=396389 RepID=UPI0003B60BDF|nr:DinB family protein [Aestuariimicrobium kwangyangense]